MCGSGSEGWNVLLSHCLPYEQGRQTVKEGTGSQPGSKFRAGNSESHWIKGQGLASRTSSSPASLLSTIFLGGRGQPLSHHLVF